jgi:hypothetical protein
MPNLILPDYQIGTPHFARIEDGEPIKWCAQYFHFPTGRWNLTRGKFREDEPEMVQTPFMPPFRRPVSWLAWLEVAFQWVKRKVGF